MINFKIMYFIENRIYRIRIFKEKDWTFLTTVYTYYVVIITRVI